MAAIDEEVEAILGHGALEHVGYHTLKAEHAVAHVDGILEQVDRRVTWDGEHRHPLSHTRIQGRGLSAY